MKDGERALRVRVVPPRYSSENVEDVGPVHSDVSSPSEKKRKRISLAAQQKEEEFLKKNGMRIANKLVQADTQGFFLEPVPTHIVTDYLRVIKRPMDLGSIRRNLSENQYASAKQMKADIDLVWANCCLYNAPETKYYQKAVKLRGIADELYDKYFGESAQSPGTKRRKSGSGHASPRFPKGPKGVGHGRPGRPRQLMVSDLEKDLDSIVPPRQQELQSGGYGTQPSEQAERLEADPASRERSVQDRKGLVHASANRSLRTAGLNSANSVVHTSRQTPVSPDVPRREVSNTGSDSIGTIIGAGGLESNSLMQKLLLNSRGDSPQQVSDKLLERALDSEMLAKVKAVRVKKMPPKKESDAFLHSLSEIGKVPEKTIRALKSVFADVYNYYGPKDNSLLEKDVDIMLRDNFSNILELHRLRTGSATEQNASAESAAGERIPGQKNERDLLQKLVQDTKVLASSVVPSDTV
uniref:Bromo domain-containing protein n=1 Tax=Rhodosorus marinus TaxID=101924 RepID=A0A7S3EHA1_9RHOD|mmetsp:Transcript_36025/g.144036  ORF Transcript_36025/g.144036 Transcript_36025/m.144036 type:complete len:468 (+) Transcript_36025:288-1691(+)